MESRDVGDIERPRIKVGFIPLIDCAPVLFADILDREDAAKKLLEEAGVGEG